MPRLHESRFLYLGCIIPSQIAFSDKPITGFIKRRMEDEERYVETILSQSSQYYKDLNSLNNEAHLKVIAVFYN